MAIQIWYHADCYDGFGAALAAYLKLGRKVAKTPVKYVPVSYADEQCPVVAPDDRVYILDFSYPREVLEGIRKGLTRGWLKVIDHHKTHYDQLKDLGYCTFDLKESGATLAWREFRKGMPEPRFFAYLRDRDLWKNELPGTHEFTAALRSYPMIFDLWVDLMDRVDELIEDGKPILRFQGQQVSLMADKHIWADIGGHLVPAVNATCFFSDVADELAKRHQIGKAKWPAPFAAYWRDLEPGRRMWGLRSRTELDVAAVAEGYGGGGHPGAAGFIVGRDDIPIATERRSLQLLDA